VFARNFLRKLSPGPRGMARVEVTALTAGEQQLCLLLAAKKLAVITEEDTKRYYLLDQAIHEHLLESLASQEFPLRAASVT